MKVRNLITTLQLYDEDAEVLVRTIDDTGDYSDMDITIKQDFATGTITIIGEETGSLSFGAMSTGGDE